MWGCPHKPMRTCPERPSGANCRAVRKCGIWLLHSLTLSEQNTVLNYISMSTCKFDYWCSMCVSILVKLAGYPLRGDHQCVWNIEYFLIIIIISLGQILLSYIANTSRIRVRTRANACTHPHTAVDVIQVIAIRWVCGTQPWRPAPLVTMAGRWPLK